MTFMLMFFSTILLFSAPIPLSASSAVNYQKCSTWFRDWDGLYELREHIAINKDGTVKISDVLNQKVDPKDGLLVVYFPKKGAPLYRSHSALIRRNKKQQVSEVIVQEAIKGMFDNEKTLQFGVRGGHCVPSRLRGHGGERILFDLDLCKDVDDFFSHYMKTRGNDLKKCFTCNEDFTRKMAVIFRKHIKDFEIPTPMTRDPSLRQLANRFSPIGAGAIIRDRCIMNNNLATFIDDDSIWKSAISSNEADKDSGVIGGK